MAPRTQFGTTWWGKAWVDALERSAMLDPSRLQRGRSYARDGSVGRLTIAPGYVAATVRGSRGRIYHTDVAVKTLAESEWEQVADAIGARAGHAAALLDGELDPALIEDAASVDVQLLPGSGDLRPDCSCPDWAEPCKHAAALCYLVANELDHDPFQLFLLRGKGREELLALVRERRPGRHSIDERSEPGVDAAAAWSAMPLGEPLAPVPESVSMVVSRHRRSPTRFATFAGRLPSRIGLEPSALDDLAHDAAERAWAMLVDGAPSGLRSEESVDLARRVAVLVDGRELAHIAALAGIPAARLTAWAAAWRLAGDDGVRVVADPDWWIADQTRLEAARESLVESGYSKRQIGLGWDALRMRSGTWLVIGLDGRWYKLREQGSRHEMHLVAGPADDVVDLVDPPA
jgi:uncharacterized Zn finger protein